MTTVANKTEPQKAATKQPSVSSAVRSTAKEMVKDAIFEKRPYLKMAFSNPYNLSLLLGGIAASVLTANPIPAVVAIGCEGLWLLHAPENKTLRRLLWDPRFEKVRLAIEALGGKIEHVIRTRMFIIDISKWEEVAKVHGQVFGEIRPATSILQVAKLIDADAQNNRHGDHVGRVQRNIHQA